MKALFRCCLALSLIALTTNCTSPAPKGLIRHSSALPDVTNTPIVVTTDSSLPIFVYSRVPTSGMTNRVQRMAKGLLYGAEDGAVTGVRTIAPVAQLFNAGKGVFISLGLLATGAVAGGSIGMTYGAIKESIAEDPAKADIALKQVLGRLDVQRAFIDHLGVSQQHSRDGTPLVFLNDGISEERPPASRLVTNVESIGFVTDAQWADPDPPLQLLLAVETRLSLRDQPDTLETSRYQYRSDAKRFREWGADDASAFGEALATAYAEIAKAVLEDLRHSGKGRASVFFVRQGVPGKAYGISVNSELDLMRLDNESCLRRSVDPSTTVVKMVALETFADTASPLQFETYAGEIYYVRIIQEPRERQTKYGTVRVHVPKFDLISDKELIETARSYCSTAS